MEIIEVTSVTEPRWMTMNVCDGPLPGGPGLPALRVLDITARCPKARERGCRQLMRFAQTRDVGLIVQFLTLNSDGEPTSWVHYSVNKLHAASRLGFYDPEFLMYHLDIDAATKGIERQSLLTLIFDYAPRATR